MVGRGPQIDVPSTANTVRLGAWMTGIVPVKMVLEAAKKVSLLDEPKRFGMGPSKPGLLEMSNQERLVKRWREASSGKTVRRLLEKSIICKEGIAVLTPYSNGGQEVNLLTVKLSILRFEIPSQGMVPLS